MKERPMLFSAPMVRAILEGRKTQTRRVVKGVDNDNRMRNKKIVTHVMDAHKVGLCPYGQPGDRLWVRETWQYADWTEDGEPYIGYAADNARILHKSMPDEWWDRNCEIWDQLSDSSNYDIDGRAADRRWRPSIHMPLWASRIALEITGVRVERLRDITPVDALKEGIIGDSFELNRQRFFRDYRLSDDEAEVSPALQSPVDSFMSLWESINGAGSWQQNPWVWVVEFRRVQP